MSSEPRIQPAGGAGRDDGAGPSDAGAGILNRPYRWVTVGMLAMILLAAFEALAVTTVMPTISRELHGGSLYALAFSGPLAVGVVGMVVAGNWSDRSGPRRPIFAAVFSFAGGLLLAGLATDMPLLVLGRLISGLGGGGLTVALYVLVARVFPERLHTKVFAAFAAAWVIPSLVGPLIAGVVAQTVGWRWVFLGVVVLVLLAMFMVVPVMRQFAEKPGDAGASAPIVPWKVSRIVWSVVVAFAVLAASLAGEVSGALVWVLSGVAVVVAIVALRPLLPVGALRSAAGLPTVIALRGLMSGAYFATETYLPYFFTSQYGLTPALAGLALSVSGLSWAGASWVQGRYSARISDVASFRVGIVLVLAAVASALGCSVLGLPPAIAITGWVFAGAGMGAMYPRLSVATLRLSTPANQGFNSSALAISDSTGAALALAITAAVFATLGGGSAGAAASGSGAPVDVLAFTGCFVVSVVLGLFSLAVAGRAEPRLRHADAVDVSGSL
ncbi:MFS transporter [Subtercola endophyticus]|uniref:MFS transporter n=1 Tax=Subtercola endophyticus TaxID=2895559 RepID=UPI001E366A77|nr:MFS transporter [Subtercola endophyticus]UFS57928.1 MFS transporter [Subtercola endophyticus]